MLAWRLHKARVGVSLPKEKEGNFVAFVLSVPLAKDWHFIRCILSVWKQ